jgi:tetratricopeptide (TPR) repeat protein
MMADRRSSLARVCRRRPAAAALALTVLAVALVAAAYQVGWHLWARRHYQGAQQAIERHDLTRARAHLRLCLQVWDTRPEPHLLFAQMLRRSRDYDEVRQHLALCEQYQGDTDAIRLERTLLLAQTGRLAGDEDQLLARAKQNPTAEPLILEALLEGYMQAHRLASGLSCADRLVELQPANVRACFQRAVILEELYLFEQAQDAFAKVVELDPEHDEARLCLGEHLVRLHRYPDAEGHFEQVLTRQPGQRRAFLGLARCRIARGQMTEALQILDNLIAATRPNVAEMLERGKVLLALGQDAQAEKWLKWVAGAAPHDPEALDGLQRLYRRRGAADKAEEYRRRAQQIETDRKSFAQVMRQLAERPRDLALLIEAGRLCVRLRRDVELVSWLHLALQVDPRNQDAHRILADFYEQTGQARLADQHRRFVLAAPPPGAPRRPPGTN